MGGQRVFIGMLVALLLSLAHPAAAQTNEQKAAAQVLFDEARKLHTAGKKEEACEKFAQSLELDRAVGTQLNLARCYEEIGKLASAWLLYNEVAGTALGLGQTKRAAHARSQADALKPRLSTLTIVAATPSDISVTHNDGAVPAAALGTAMPVDAGTHTIIARAEGKKEWRTTVEVPGDAAAVTVDIPALEDLPQVAKPPPPEPVEPPPHEPESKTVWWALGSVSLAMGLGGGAAGTALRIMALDKDDESLDQCLKSDPNRCSAEGADLRDRAKTLQTASTIAWAGGGAFAVAAIVMLVYAGTVSDEDESAGLSIDLGPQRAGVAVHGSF